MPQTQKPKAIAAVSAVIIMNDAVLLVKRSKAPLMNTWNLPGGKVEDGEANQQAIIREVFEETNLHISSPILLGETTQVFENANEDEHTYEIKIFTSHTIKGQAQAGNDATELKYVLISELDQYSLANETLKLIDQATCHPLRRHTMKGHLKTALIALFFGLAAYGFLFGLMKILKASGFQTF
jgi:8-oxo-dGTP diphosphatase